jgi:ZIP family zinc transporter
MAAALGWGTLAASSLVIGALLAYARRWPDRQVGLVLSFGAGALISAISFELASEGIEVGSIRSTALGLGLGAFAFFFFDGRIDAHFSKGGGRRARAKADDPGIALALGAFLDGIPEQLVLGIGLAGGQSVGLGLLVAIFVSNLPESIGSATAMDDAGEPRDRVIRLWIGVAAICALSTVLGYGLADITSGDLRAAIDGFAAGALLVMLIDSMIPEATGKSGRVAGLATTLGFAVATALSSLD